MDIDAALGQIARQAPEADLSGLDGRVLASIADGPSRSAARRAALAGAGFALLLGVAGGVSPAPEARASSEAPIGVPGALTPSTLLSGL